MSFPGALVLKLKQSIKQGHSPQLGSLLLLSEEAKCYNKHFTNFRLSSGLTTVCFAGKMSHVPLYKVWDTTSTSTSGCPMVQLECLVIFLTTAIEWLPNSLLACMLLHSCLLSFEGEGTSKILVPCFCGVATCCFLQLTSVNVPLVKPLSLLITVCFIILPEHVVKILSVEEDGSSNVTEDGASQGLLTWAEALAGLAESASDPGLSLKSEMKLAGKLPCCDKQI